MHQGSSMSTIYNLFIQGFNTSEIYRNPLPPNISHGLTRGTEFFRGTLVLAHGLPWSWKLLAMVKLSWK